jgi:hypothetical protein
MELLFGNVPCMQLTEGCSSEFTAEALLKVMDKSTTELLTWGRFARDRRAS